MTNNISGPQAAGRIQFQACSFYCRVWLNGIEIGDHTSGGYVSWWLDVPSSVLELGHQQPKKKKTTTIGGYFDNAEGNVITSTNSTTSTAMDVAVHELFVLVDNRFNSTTAPMHTGGDFWHYGGIMRSVEWHDRPSLLSSSYSNSTTRDDGPICGFGGADCSTKKESNAAAKNTDGTTADSIATDPRSYLSVWPWRLYVFPQKDLRTVKLSLQLVGDNGSGESNMMPKGGIDLLKELRRTNQIVIYFDGDASMNALDDYLISTESSSSLSSQHVDSDTTMMATATTSAQRGNDRLVELGHFSVPKPRIWSTTDPQLHTVSVYLNGAIVTERFGLRYWDVGDYRYSDSTNPTNSSSSSRISRIRLNRDVLKLVGWNHHTQWPYTAASPTDKQLDDDIRLLKESGHVNFVRGAHYPQDPRWLDRLDEQGIVVWCGE